MPLDTTCWPELLLWRHHCHKPTRFPCTVYPAYLDSLPVQTTKDLTCLKSRKKLTSDYFYNQEKHDMIRMIVSNYRLIHYEYKRWYRHIKIFFNYLHNKTKKDREKNPPTNRAIKKPQKYQCSLLLFWCLLFVICCFLVVVFFVAICFSCLFFKTVPTEWCRFSLF